MTKKTKQKDIDSFMSKDVTYENTTWTVVEVFDASSTLHIKKKEFPFNTMFVHLDDVAIVESSVKVKE